MCGRFTQAYTWRELVALYGLTQPATNLQPRYNIAPTATIDLLNAFARCQQSNARVGLILWGK